MLSKEELAREMTEAISEWDKAKLIMLVRAGMQAGLTPMEIANEMLVPTLQKACRDIDSFDITFPELLLLADTIKAALDLLIPEIRTAFPADAGRGRIVIGTVEGDIHDLGKTLVAAILESAGYHVTDLGRNVAAKAFISAIKSEKAHILAASTLLTPTLVSVEELIKEVRSQKLRVKTIIGGWATTPEFARKIGADAWAEDALEGLLRIDKLMRVFRDE